jgi:hypothetical protein
MSVGVGVDDTRMDLSQFDEAGRSLPASQPILLDLGSGLIHSAESSDVESHINLGLVNTID